MKIDPIIAVIDVKASAIWYESVFDCKNVHGGEDFAVLISKEEEVLLCLHKWGEHDHPSMKEPEGKKPGNGLILYFKTDNMHQIRQNVEELGYHVEKEVELNPNSGKTEFSLRDLDGYYLTISEFHKYEG